VSYVVLITRAAERDLEHLPREAQRQARAAIRALADDPRPAGSLQLRDAKGVKRLRVGDYRAAYTVDDGSRAVNVLRIGHRSTFYKRLKGE